MGLAHPHPRVPRPRGHRRTVAEYWLGAHASGPSSFDDAPGETLASYLSANPEVIGERNVEQFGAKLPYMMKLLSAAGPLSLQVHPTRDQAIEG